MEEIDTSHGLFLPYIRLLFNYKLPPHIRRRRYYISKDSVPARQLHGQKRPMLGGGKDDQSEKGGSGKGSPQNQRECWIPASNEVGQQLSGLVELMNKV